MSGGYIKYLKNVVPRISRHAEVDSILCATPSSLSIENKMGMLPNVRFITCQPIHLLRGKKDSGLYMDLDRYDPDLIYVPVERRFHFKSKPVVTMLQNMEPFISPYRGNPFSEKIKNWFRCRSAIGAIMHTDRIIAISRFVKDFLMRRYGIQENRIGMVYHGLDTSRKLDIRGPTSVLPLHDKPFLFTAGSIRPARGLEDIFKAMAHLKRKTGNTPGLVIGGHTDPVMAGYRKKLVDSLGKNDLSEDVIWVGPLNEGEMAWCYQHCAAFIMSSRVESFGQTAVEAMSYGCSCISANNPCLPEIFGDAALYYQPMDHIPLADAIRRILGKDDDVCRTLPERAHKRAKEFSWDVSASKTVDEFRKALAG